MKSEALRVSLLAALGGLLVALPFFAPVYYVDLLILTLIYGLLVTGMTLLTSYSGLVSLGHAAFFGLGAYAAVVTSGTYGLNPWLGLIIGGVVAGGAALLIGVTLLRLSGHYLVMVTLAWGVVASTIFVHVRSVTGGADGFSNVPTLSIGSLEFTNGASFYYLMLVMTGGSIAMLWSLLGSRSGRAIRALRDTEVAATSVGVNVDRLKLEVFIVSGILAGLAGGFFAFFMGFIAPTAFDVGVSIKVLVMTMIGGAHPLGGVLGAGIVVALDNVIQQIMPNGSSIAGETQNIAHGAVLALVMIGSPAGLAPVLKWLFPRKRYAAASFGTDEPLGSGPSPGSLTVHGLQRRFGGLAAVDGLSLQVDGGHIAALIGPNGAGKTTAFNLITGVLHPDAGQITLDGKDITSSPARKMAKLGLARTFQNAIPFHMSVLENVMMGCYVHAGGNFLTGMLGLERRANVTLRKEAAGIARSVGLNELDAMAHTLTAGQRRQLEVARALATRPRVMLLDEPAAGLRAAEKQDLAKLLRGLSIRGMALLLVEHDMGMVMKLADRVTVMNSGRLLAQGVPRDIARNPQVVEAYLGDEVS